MRIRCECGATFNIDNGYVGRQVICLECRRALIATPTDNDTAPSATRFSWITLGLVGGLSMLLILLVGIILQGSSDPSRTAGKAETRSTDPSMNESGSQSTAGGRPVVRNRMQEAIIRCQRGDTHLETGQFDKAIADYTAALRLNPLLADAFCNRALAYSHKGEFDKAIADLGEAIDLDPNAEAYCHRGVVYSKAGEFVKALVDFNKALELAPQYAEAYYSRGNASAKEHYAEIAIADFTKAIQLDPKHAEAYHARGVCYAAMGEHDNAIADFTQTIRLNAECTSAYLRRGHIYMEEVDQGKAEADFAKARQLGIPEAMQMYLPMSVAELSKQWRRESLRYVAAMNKFVERGMKIGWDKGGKPAEETRQPLARRVIDALREANRNDGLTDFRERFPPAHSPFIEMLDQNGQHIAPLALLDDGRIVLGIGYENGRVVVINGTKVESVAGALTFGRSPNRKYFAVAREKSIDIHEGWGRAKVASLNWPKIGPLDGVQCIEQLIPFPDGQRVVLATPDAIMVVESEHTELLYPRDIEQLQENFGQVNLNNPHAAISPDGSLISIGDRLTCKHIVFNGKYEVVGEFSPLVDVAPCHTSFSGDSELLTLSSFRLYNGATLGVPTSRFPGLSISDEVLHKRLLSENATGEKRIPGLGLIGRSDWFSENTIAEIRKRLEELDQGLILLDYNARVYAAVWRGEEFIIGDAYGYLRAFDKRGKYRWQHFVGSSIGDIDLSPDSKTLVVTTGAGFLCIIDLDTGERDPFTISTATHRERRRWLFWSKESRHLVW